MQNQVQFPKVVWWGLWAALQLGLFLHYHFLGRNSEAPLEADVSAAWLICLVPVVISAVIRWIVLPRFQTGEAAFPWFLAGMAIAEATNFFGIFLFPAHKQELFVWSVLGVFQFIPFSAQRYSVPTDPHHDALRQ